MLGSATVFLDMLEQVSNAAPLNRPVLVIGERGTGKEQISARLHYLSPRWERAAADAELRRAGRIAAGGGIVRP
jgi:transcriptional regulator with AAA-type ATPase domain